MYCKVMDRPQEHQPLIFSLPAHLLTRCLTFVKDSGFDRDDREWLVAQQSAFSTCKAFAQAMLVMPHKPRLNIWVDERGEGSILALASALKWATPSCSISLELHLQSAVHASTSLVLQMLHRVLGPIPAVTKLHCQEVLLEWPSHAPLAILFPNLREVTLNKCCYQVLGGMPLDGCNQLAHLKLGIKEYPCMFSASPTPPALGWPLAELPWGPQLAQLSNLSALDLYVSKCMHSAEKRVLAAVAHRSSLRRLELGSCDIATLVTLALLPKLQEVAIGEARGGDDDAVLQALLCLPHVTSIACPRLSDLRRWYAHASCTWQQFSIRTATPQLLARLPLHALQQPLQMRQLRLDTASVDDMQLAVENLARSGQPVFSLCSPGFELGFSKVQHPTVIAPILQAAGPLLPRNVNRLRFWKLQMDGEVVQALREALPSNIKCLDLRNSHMQPSAWVQLGRLLGQQLEEVEIWHHATYTPVVVLAYFTVAWLNAGRPKAGGLPRVAKLRIYDLYRHRQESWNPEQAQLLRETMQAMGLPPDHYLTFL